MTLNLHIKEKRYAYSNLQIVLNPVAETVQHGSERCRLFYTLQINPQKEIFFNFMFKLICFSFFKLFFFSQLSEKDAWTGRWDSLIDKNFDLDC